MFYPCYLALHTNEHPPIFQDTTPTPEDPDNAFALSHGKKDYKERQESGSSQSHSSLFPVWLLEQHQPCRNLVSLHSSIRHRCSAVLGQHYRPVPALPDHHYFVSMDGLTASSQVRCSFDSKNNTIDIRPHKPRSEWPMASRSSRSLSVV